MRDDFAKRLTLVRKERGISQKQAAADLEVSQALLSHYERGVRECGLDFVVRCARYYGVSSDYLLGPVSYTHLDVYKRQPMTCSRTARARRCFRRHIRKAAFSRSGKTGLSLS